MVVEMPALEPPTAKAVSRPEIVVGPVTIRLEKGASSWMRPVPRFSILARAKRRPDTSGHLRGMIAPGAAVLHQASPLLTLRVAGAPHAERILQGFSGTLQVDGYAGYNRLM